MDVLAVTRGDDSGISALSILITALCRVLQMRDWRSSVELAACPHNRRDLKAATTTMKILKKPYYFA